MAGVLITSGCSETGSSQTDIPASNQDSEAKGTDELLETYIRNIVLRKVDENEPVIAEMTALTESAPTPYNELLLDYMRLQSKFLRGEIAAVEREVSALAEAAAVSGNDVLYLATVSLFVNVLSEQGRMGSARDVLEETLTKITPVEFSSADILVRRAKARLYQGESEYLSAIQTIMPIVDYFEGQNEYSILADLYGDLALIFTNIRQLDEALSWHERALRLFYANEDRVGIARTMNNLASFFELTGEFERSADSLQVAIAINREKESWLNLARNYYNAAMAYKDMKDFERAAEHYRLGLEMSERVGSVLGVMFNTYGVGEMILNKSGDIEQARQQFISALEIAEEVEHNGIRTNSLRQLYEIEKSIGNYQAALEYHEQFLEMTILFQERARDTAIQDLMIQHDVEQTRNENLLLSERLVFEETTSRNRLTIIVLLVIGLVTAILFVVYALATKKRLQKAFVDIKNQRAMLQVQNEQLEKIGQERDGFLHIIVHDLKNPLSVIKSSVELIKEDLQDNPLVSLVERSLLRTDLLIKSLLNVFRMDQLDVMNQLERQQSDQVIKRMRNEYTLVAKSKNITLHCRCDSFSFNTHLESFQGIVGNLISNAIKYAPPNTEVWVDMSREEDHFRLSIEDQGPGFSSHDMDKIFKPFAKLSAKSTAGESSTGIGLYSVKTSVSRLKGEIFVEKSRWGGAAFRLKFPFLPLAEPEAEMVD